MEHGSSHFIVEMYTGIIFGSFEPSLGSVDDVKLKTVLEPFGGKDIFDDLRCEFVFGTSPECSKPNLGIGVHGRFLQEPFRDGKIDKQTGSSIEVATLGPLDEHKFEASIISTTDKKRDWGPDAQVLMFTLVPKGQFSLHQLVVAELIFFLERLYPRPKTWCMADQ